MPVIETQNLIREFKIPQHKKGISGSLQYMLHPKYSAKLAVSDISFHIESGESVAFIGANGAGKSTTIKMLTGILKPTSGMIRVNNLDPFKNRIQNAQSIGVIFGQKTQLWWDIPVRETFELLQHIYKIPDSIYNENLTIFTDLLDLGSFLEQPPRKLSLGQRVRADFAAALLHNPSILYLDEPTIGLDLAVKKKVYEFLQIINKRNSTTIILTSHDLKDIEKICNRCLIIDRGTIIYDDLIDKVSVLSSEQSTLSIEYEQLLAPVEIISQHFKIKDISDSKIIFYFDKGKKNTLDFLNQLSNFVSFSEFEYQTPSLEQIIIELFERNSKQ